MDIKVGTFIHDISKRTWYEIKVIYKIKDKTNVLLVDKFNNTTRIIDFNELELICKESAMNK